MEIIKFEELENRLIKYQDRYVLVDRDVAQLYGVETRDINKAVANNPEKFPEGYIIELNEDEKKELVEESKQNKEKLFHKPQTPTQKKSAKRYHDDGPLEKKESKSGAPKIRAASGNLEPEYPFEARQKGLEATVRLILKVNQSGKVEKVDVLTKNLPDCFIQSAIKAAKSWRFIVQEELTSPLVDVEVPFTFKLLEES